MFYGVLKSQTFSQQTEKQLRKHNQDLRGQQQLEVVFYWSCFRHRSNIEL